MCVRCRWRRLVSFMPSVETISTGAGGGNRPLDVSTFQIAMPSSEAPSSVASIIPEVGPDPVAAVRAGLPFTALEHVRDYLDAPDDLLARALGISARTLSRRRNTGTLTHRRIRPTRASGRDHCSRAAGARQRRGRSRMAPRSARNARWGVAARPHGYCCGHAGSQDDALPHRIRHAGIALQLTSPSLTALAVITIWRLEKERYVDTAFRGKGSLKTSGRWHHKGTQVAYAASIRAWPSSKS